MGFIPVANVAQVQMIYSWDGQAVENVYNYEFATQPITSIMVDLAADMVDWWVTNMKSSCPENFSLVKVVVTDLTAQNSPGVEYQIGLPQAGTSTNEFMPNNVTVAIKWNTDFRGRSYRGRTYHMPINREWVTNNMIEDSSLAGLIASYTLLPDITAAGANPVMVVVSRFHNGSARSAGVTTAIQSVSADNVLDSQRRRLPGRGQ